MLEAAGSSFPAKPPTLLILTFRLHTPAVLADSGEVFNSLPSALPTFDQWLNYSAGVNINKTIAVRCCGVENGCGGWTWKGWPNAACVGRAACCACWCQQVPVLILFHPCALLKASH